MTAPASFLHKTAPTSTCWWATPRVHMFTSTLGNAEPLMAHIERAAELKGCALGDGQIALGTLLTLALTAMANGDDEDALIELGAALALIKAEADQLDWVATQIRVLEG